MTGEIRQGLVLLAFLLLLRQPVKGGMERQKAGLVCAAHCLSTNVAFRKIRVDCISLGLVFTPMVDATVQDQVKIFYTARAEQAYPLEFEKPKDVARMAVFLLSSVSGWITDRILSFQGDADGRYHHHW